MSQKALGLIELLGFVGVVEAADAAAKAASVEVCAFERADGGLVSIQILGDVGAVMAAVEAGSRAAQNVGDLVASHVIPNPHAQLVEKFGLNHQANAPVDLETLSVTQLRQLARKTPTVAIQGREVSRANRDRLIRELRKAGLAN
jgi:ethanolamine utilization protein EutM